MKNVSGRETILSGTLGRPNAGALVARQGHAEPFPFLRAKARPCRATSTEALQIAAIWACGRKWRESDKGMALPGRNLSENAPRAF